MSVFLSKEYKVLVTCFDISNLSYIMKLELSSLDNLAEEKENTQWYHLSAWLHDKSLIYVCRYPLL